MRFCLYLSCSFLQFARICFTLGTSFYGKRNINGNFSHFSCDSYGSILCFSCQYYENICSAARNGKWPFPYQYDVWIAFLIRKVLGLIILGFIFQYSTLAWGYFILMGKLLMMELFWQFLGFTMLTKDWKIYTCKKNFVKKMFPKISENCQENTFTEALFSIKLKLF